MACRNLKFTHYLINRTEGFVNDDRYITNQAENLWRLIKKILLYGHILHMQLYIHIYMQKHIQHIKDERTLFFTKIYLSLYLKGFKRVTKGFTVWEVSWRLNRTATHWRPTLMAITAFLSRSPGLPNQGPGGPASLGHGSHSSIFSPTVLRPWTPTAQSGVLLGAGSLYSIFSSTDLNFLSPGLYNNLTSTYFLRESQFGLYSTHQPLRLSPDIFDRMHLLFTQVHFFFWQLGRGQYVTILQEEKYYITI